MERERNEKEPTIIFSLFQVGLIGLDPKCREDFDDKSKSAMTGGGRYIIYIKRWGNEKGPTRAGNGLEQDKDFDTFKVHTLPMFPTHNSFPLYIYFLLCVRFFLSISLNYIFGF